jgi:high-affinity iron transporter
MLAGLLITFREGLEAALVVGIVHGYLRQIGRGEHSRYVWMGVVLAVGSSLALVWGIQRVGFELEGRAEALFEGAAMFLAVLVLTWMIYWMRYQARLVRSTLERDVQRAVEAGDRRGLAAVAFVAVFREGVETALFVSAAAFAARGGATLSGAAIGLALAAVLGLGIYASTVNLPVRWFFNATSALLLVFAAGLLAHGVHEFQAASFLPTLKPRLWDVTHILSEDSFVGQLLKSLAGYNADPSLEEVLAYVAYWIFALLGIRLLVERSLQRRGQSEAANGWPRT